MLNIQKTLENGSAVFALQGRLDTVSAPALEQALKDALPELRELTLDLSALDYISSAGLRVLLSAQKQIQRQGTMKLTGVNEAVREIFDVTGFSEILTIV